MISASSVRLVMTALMAFMMAMTTARHLQSTKHHARSTILSPAADPFYNPPVGYESEVPGTILRQRNISAAVFGIIKDPVKVYQLLYRTTAVNGSAITTVTTVFKPSYGKKDRFISFQTAYDSLYSACEPSYNYQFGANETELISAAETLILQAYLLLGYTVASSDYEGQEAAFGAGRLAGMAVLDNMRAVSAFKPLGFTTDTPKIVGIGYSGGAIAASWGAALQPTYAPELDIKGWVSGGTPANLTATMLSFNDGEYGGFIPIALAGMSQPSAYGATLAPLLDQILTSDGRTKIEYAKTHCAADNIGNLFFQSMLSTDFQTLGEAFLTNTVFTDIMEDCLLVGNKTETPTSPMLIYHSAVDEIIPYAPAKVLADTWCDNGAGIEFITFANGGHITTDVIGLPYAIEFTASAFEGNLTKGCTRKTQLESVLNPISLATNLEPLGTDLISIIVDLGKGDSNLKNNVAALKQLVHI
ncbi:hypothetical protein N7495_004309 [Penicillium taxi]|uniref:uncharacterized protein n=1 Tax=Penicillium taxi TaxID=168475 RepID=UPI002545734A|nr:uncharacterized protein N7495_004309 [Penicillium taxi]KAJ5899565.1 hypothetical protein N7495_004309 [Penicillium taxi]